MQSFGDNKAKVYYKRNYGQNEEKNETSQDINALQACGDVFSPTIHENINHNSITQSCIERMNTVNSLLDDYVKTISAWKEIGRAHV